MSVNHQLKNRLRDLPADTAGKVVFGSGAAEGESADKPAIGMPVSGDVQAQVPKLANYDPLVGRAVASSGQELHADAKTVETTIKGNLVESPDDLFTVEEVTLTEDDRSSFLDSLISGGRYERKFSIYDGRIKGRFRSRSTVESEAIAAWMNTGIRESKYKSPLDYAIDVRNALLASQVLELNGTRFPELPTPLYRTQNGEKVTDPGWLAAANEWSKKAEPVVAGVYEELRMFERKYWTMIAHARDQNFWHPAESTSK